MNRSRQNQKNRNNIMKIIKSITLLLLVAAMATLSGCEKEKDLIIGKWTNTANSGMITFAGYQDIPADCITMEFTDNEVVVSDIRVNCLPEAVGYTLIKEDGKLLLCLDECAFLYSSTFNVEKLDKDQMVLTFPTGMMDIDMGFQYVMKRCK